MIPRVVAEESQAVSVILVTVLVVVLQVWQQLRVMELGVCDNGRNYI